VTPAGARSDLLIAGGGPAGSLLAVLAGRAGLSVRLFEAARFPRD
jgi:flavin-dependent dehydrogenase